MTADPKPCSKCGEPHPRCRAHKRNGMPCSQPPIRGVGVCRMHGGTSPQVQAAIARREQEAAAQEAMTRFGWEPDTDAHRELARLINISAGLVTFYGWQCRQLHPDALVWGDAEAREDALRGLTVIQRAEVNLWVRLYTDERKELRILCKTAIDAGLAEREVRLLEQQGAMVVEVLRVALSDLELNPDQQTRALRVIPQRLREYGVKHEFDTTVIPLTGTEG